MESSIDFATVSSLQDNGFLGFAPICKANAWLKAVPSQKGVYVVVTPFGFNSAFLENGSGGFFKGRDPNVSVATLQDNWVDGSRVINIGQAGGGGSANTLRKRIHQYLRFGQGEAVGHYGGRLIWQLRDHRLLMFAWKMTEDDPREVERALIADFRSVYGVRPFANLRD